MDTFMSTMCFYTVLFLILCFGTSLKVFVFYSRFF